MQHKTASLRKQLRNQIYTVYRSCCFRFREKINSEQIEPDNINRKVETLDSKMVLENKRMHVCDTMYSSLEKNPNNRSSFVIKTSAGNGNLCTPWY